MGRIRSRYGSPPMDVVDTQDEYDAYYEQLEDQDGDDYEE